ncbi:uncharacterized protein LOC129748333 [Uranotaenia lowii]|uniref:uncharacterized protein LOC129748333 n=1 Tax=Uranotaenia lowii TaxID=190385 RepID=UPI00247981EB|nr:uncharacterized protein LOC129748333 [Uranotaenia lowii]
MLIKEILLILVVHLILTIADDGKVSLLPEWLVFAGKTKVEIQILEPRGIQVWTKYKPKYLVFGIELMVNPSNDRISGCDFCKNVSEPIDGKFLMENDDLKINLGDTIKYRYVKVKTSGVKWSPWRTVFVDKNLFSNFNDHCSVICEQSVDQAKIRFLEGYLDNLLDSCGLIPPSEHLFIPFEHALQLVSDPERFVKSRLYSYEALRNLMGSVTGSYLSQDGVGFSMKTVRDKLKVLEIGREIGIVDYDNYMTEPHSSF